MNIKKILVPTDFSNAANNALLYAADLAERYGAEVEIVHVFSVPPSTVRGMAVLPDDDTVHVNLQVAKNDLERVKKLVAGKDTVKFSLNPILINWQFELAEVIQDQHADLIVMGTTGASGLKRFFLGSNAARVIQDSPVPVLVIPEETGLSQHITIGFAYDGLEVSDIRKLSIIDSLSSVLKGKIKVFQIKEGEEITSPYLNDIMSFLPGAEYIDIEASSIESEILKCIELGHIDLLVMMPRKRGFFHNLISDSITESVVYETSIPLLAIPE